MNSKRKNMGSMLLLVGVGIWVLVGCRGAVTEVPGATAVLATNTADEHDDLEAGQDDYDGQVEMLRLPTLAPVELNGELLQVVVTTSIIGDVVAQVGGDAIHLMVLAGPGQDPHSYEPGAQQLAAVATADVIFVNGWDLEERLVSTLASIGENVPQVPVSANIVPLPFDGHGHGADDDEEGEVHQEANGHGKVDPHTWTSIANVMQWTENVKQALSELDPAHAETYAHNAAAYGAELAQLEAYVEAQLATIPASHRILVTNHDSLGYFAAAYQFEVLGTVIPSMSTLAEPSATDLVNLVTVLRAQRLCTLFTEITNNASLAQTVAAELTHCDKVQVLPLHTDALGPVGSGADSYIGMIRANVQTIVRGLQP